MLLPVIGGAGESFAVISGEDVGATLIEGGAEFVGEVCNELDDVGASEPFGDVVVGVVDGVLAGVVVEEPAAGWALLLVEDVEFDWVAAAGAEDESEPAGGAEESAEGWVLLPVDGGGFGWVTATGAEDVVEPVWEAGDELLGGSDA